MIAKKKKVKKGPKKKTNKMPKFTHIAVYVPGCTTAYDLAKMAHAIKHRLRIETYDDGFRIVMYKNKS